MFLSNLFAQEWILQRSVMCLIKFLIYAKCEMQTASRHPLRLQDQGQRWDDILGNGLQSFGY